MYDPAVGGAGEARLIAIRDLIRERMSGLETALRRDSFTSSFLAAPFPQTLDPVKVCNIGEVALVWDASEGCLKISVISGTGGMSTGWVSSWQTIDRSATHGIEQEYTTSIYAYLHQNAIPTRDVVRALERKEIALERIMDWFRAGVFNAPYYDPNNGDYRPADIPLTSREYHDVGYDRLTRCMVTSGSTGTFSRGFGNSEILVGIHLVHVGHIG